jgi:hypothetical protein
MVEYSYVSTLSEYATEIHLQHLTEANHRQPQSSEAEREQRKIDAANIIQEYKVK